MSNDSLAGTVSIVTGGGRGIGRGHVLELTRHKVRVVVNDVVPEVADAVVTEVHAMGGEAVASYQSVATKDGCDALVQDAIDAFGTVDSLVNNAGFMRNGMFEAQTTEMLSDVLAVHVYGAFFLTQALWPLFCAKGYGRVVMTSSAGGLFAMQGEANYATAKAGLYGLTKALAFEGRPHGIMVNAVLPHAITTMTANDPVPHSDQYQSQELRKALAPRRLAEAVSPLVAYLVSRECQLTGEAFAAGCGRFARVFVGETLGWVAADATSISMEDVIAHIAEIRDLEGYAIPTNLWEEVELMARVTGVVSA